MTEQPRKMKYRHEYKYLIDSMENAVLKTSVNSLLKPDVHTKGSGYYRIRSLYFDSPGDDCYYENESGIGERDKYRIRIYNGDAGRIVLEKKSKRRQMTLKRSCLIDEGLCRRLMSGNYAPIAAGMRGGAKLAVGNAKKGHETGSDRRIFAVSLCGTQRQCKSHV